MANLFLVQNPRITEKAANLAATRQYVFDVAKAATKNEIKKAVKEMFKVDAIRVNITNLPGKSKGFGKLKGHVGAQKKAIVTLKEGQAIDMQ